MGDGCRHKEGKSHDSKEDGDKHKAIGKKKSFLQLFIAN